MEPHGSQNWLDDVGFEELIMAGYSITPRGKKYRCLVRWTRNNGKRANASKTFSAHARAEAWGRKKVAEIENGEIGGKKEPERFKIDPTHHTLGLNSWRKVGVWDHLLEEISKGYDGDLIMIDGSCVRVRQHGATAKKGMKTMVAWDVPVAV